MERASDGCSGDRYTSTNAADGQTHQCGFSLGGLDAGCQHHDAGAGHSTSGPARSSIVAGSECAITGSECAIAFTTPDDGVIPRAGGGQKAAGAETFAHACAGSASARVADAGSASVRARSGE